MSRKGALDRIDKILTQENGGTKMRKVYRGDPTDTGLSLGEGPFAAYWIGGEVTKDKTFGNVMVTHQITVAVYWAIPNNERQLAANELAIWEAMRDIQTAFRADSDLGGNTTDLEIDEAEVGTLPVGRGTAAEYRVLRFELHLIDLEEEAISA